MAKFYFTAHAIDRYIERYAQSTTQEEALKYLLKHQMSAVRLKVKTLTGQEQWKVGDVLVVAKHDPNAGRMVVVTILPARVMTPKNAVPDEELLMALELVEERGYSAVGAYADRPLREDQNGGMSGHKMKGGITVGVKHVAHAAHIPRPDEIDVAVYRLKLDTEQRIENNRSRVLEHLAQYDRRRTEALEALRMAMSFIASLNTPEARQALRRIGGVNPRFARPEFMEGADPPASTAIVLPAAEPVEEPADDR
jgi:hypothetical protein